MSMSDPIADMLTRIRNAQAMEKTSVTMPASKVKTAIARVLKDEGYIEDFKIAGDVTKVAELEIGLKYYAGRPVIESIARGVDMFDCVMPTRIARNGTAVLRGGRRFSVRAGAYKKDTAPIEEGCTCYACANFSRAYVRHLLNTDEILGARLLTMHNLHRYLEFLTEIREAIEKGTLGELRAFVAEQEKAPVRT